MEVIAYVLKHLKQCLRDKLSRAAPQLTTADIHWVITVPAIWKPDGKQMMREAAYKVTDYIDTCIIICHMSSEEHNITVRMCTEHTFKVLHVQ